jgi:hypothetical protein
VLTASRAEGGASFRQVKIGSTVMQTATGIGRAIAGATAGYFAGRTVSLLRSYWNAVAGKE